MNDWLAYFRKDGNFSIAESGKCRFEHDHLNVNNEDYAIVVDGLILNQHGLRDQYRTFDFFTEFRGPFTGLYYDKHAQKAVVFINQTGDSAVFYYLSDTLQAFSSNFNMLLDFLHQQQIPIHLDEKAAHWMLSFGYLIDEATFAQEIKRLRAGKALYLETGRWTERRYHLFDSNLLDISEDEAIERIDVLFRQAVKRCFDKDLEYGYTQHLVDMSAGMDSRMVNCVAKAMGYGPITNISYSQTGSEEEAFSKQASKLFGNEMIFESLDNHEFIYDIDELLKGNFGTYLYTGITGGARLLSKLDFSQFGTEQTGQLGDIILGGTFAKTEKDTVNPKYVRLSQTLPLKFDPNPERFEHQDQFILYIRGFMGAMSSWFIRKQYTFALSPFTDVDFMEFCYSLPVAMRRNHNLYWKWVERYYPAVLSVPTSRKRMPVTTAQKAVDLASRAFHKGQKVCRKLLFKAGLVSTRVNPKSSMNPYEYWYDTDPKMRVFFDTYYSNHIDLLSDKPELQHDVETLFHSDVMLEKLMALTVLGMASRL